MAVPPPTISPFDPSAWTRVTCPMRLLPLSVGANAFWPRLWSKLLKESLNLSLLAKILAKITTLTHQNNDRNMAVWDDTIMLHSNS